MSLSNCMSCGDLRWVLPLAGAATRRAAAAAGLCTPLYCCTVYTTMQQVTCRPQLLSADVTITLTSSMHSSYDYDTQMTATVMSDVKTRNPFSRRGEKRSVFNVQSLSLGI